MGSVYCTALIAGSLLTLTSCFNKLDTAAIEQEIEAEIESQSRRISLSEVRCPRDVYRQSGAYFRCVGQLRPEGQFTINVTQKDNEGAIEWDVPSSQVIINMAKTEEKLQEAFAKQFSKRAALDCGELYRVNQPGEQFECEVIGGVNLGPEAVIALLVKVDPEGNLTWYEVREPIAPVINTATTTPTTALDAAGDSAASPPTQPRASQETPAPSGNVAGSEKNRYKPPVIAP